MSFPSVSSTSAPIDWKAATIAASKETGGNEALSEAQAPAITAHARPPAHPPLHERVQPLSATYQTLNTGAAGFARSAPSTPELRPSAPVDFSPSRIQALLDNLSLDPSAAPAAAELTRTLSLLNVDGSATDAAHRLALHLLSGGSTGPHHPAAAHESYHLSVGHSSGAHQRSHSATSSRRASLVSLSDTFAAEEAAPIGPNGIVSFHSPFIRSAYVTPKGVLYITGPSLGARIRVEDLSQRRNIGVGYSSADVTTNADCFRITYADNIVLAHHTADTHLTDSDPLVHTIIDDMQSIHDRLVLKLWTETRQVREGTDGPFVPKTVTFQEMVINETFPSVVESNGAVLVEYREGKYHCIYEATKDYNILAACYGNGKLYCATDNGKVLVIADKKPTTMRIIELPADVIPQPGSYYIPSYKWIRAMQFATYVHPTVQTIKECIATLQREDLSALDAERALKDAKKALKSAKGILPRDALEIVREAIQTVEDSLSRRVAMVLPDLAEELDALAIPISSVVVIGNNNIAIIKAS